GKIYCLGQNRLAVEVDHHPKVVRTLTALEGITWHQDGNKEKTFLFPLELFDKVAGIVHPAAGAMGIRRMELGCPLTGSRKRSQKPLRSLEGDQNPIEAVPRAWRSRKLA